MKIQFKINGNTETVEFSTSPSRTGFSVMAKSSKDLEKLQNVISSSDSSMVIQRGIQKYIESKLKLPIEIDYDFHGFGYGFKFDMYSLLGKLK